jgi:hypothetical protein
MNVLIMTCISRERGGAAGHPNRIVHGEGGERRQTHHRSIGFLHCSRRRLEIVHVGKVSRVP